ncbi:MAG: TetR/AcrR family transcriptional regulator [Proteobacteria bacterium]|nr:TetR/AcrR family transcriptional regulator [Pseudomonadota bacterium]
MGSKERRAREKNKRIAQIQKAARTVFLKKGYQNATMEEIATRAEVSKGTVYFYFKSKDELYVSLMIPHIEKLRDLLEVFERRLIEEETGPDFDLIAEVYHIFVQTYEFDPEGVHIYQIFQLNDLFPVMPQATKDRVVALGQANFTMLRRMIEFCIERGLLRDVAPLPLVDFLWGAFLGVIQLQKSKRALHHKDHLAGTLRSGVSALARGLAPENH